MGRFIFFLLLLLNTLPAWAQSYSMPFRFEANQGQAAACVKYIARGGNYTADLNQNEVVIHVGRESVRMQFAGGRPAAAIEPMEELAERTNYYGGSRENWFTDIRNYRRVLYRNVYPKIDVAFRSEGSVMEFDFVAAPGADIAPIGLDFSGQKSLKITDSANLLIQTESGDLQLHTPHIYQDHDGRHSAVEGRFVKRGGRIAIETGDYDKSIPLVIDPKMTYSTYAGGSGRETATDIAVDDAGNIYVVFDVYRANDETGGSFWIMKLARDGSPGYFTSLGTYITSEAGRAIAVDSSRNAYVAGLAQTYGNGHPEFPTLNPVIFSMFLGGDGEDIGLRLVLDSAGAIYVAGNTTSNNFPGYPARLPSSTTNVFVTKLNAAATAILSTWIQTDKSLIDFSLEPTGARYLLYKSIGSDTPQYTLYEESADGTARYAVSFQGVPNAVAVDADGSAYVTGTDSSDVFVEKITAVNHTDAVSRYHVRFSGTKTFENLPDSLGTYETGTAIAVDRPDRVYVAGTSTAYDFPTTNGTHRSPLNITSDRDAIIFVLEPDNAGDEFSPVLKNERGLKPATTLKDEHRSKLNRPQLDQHRPQM